MDVLMIGQLTGKDYATHLKDEGTFIAKARADGLVRDVYLKADHTGPVLVLTGVSADEARERMATLPFIVHDIATFSYIELVQPTSGASARD